MIESLIVIAALFAGLIDSIVGGGGLILIPALFSAYPDALPATLFGTNKSASICGTSVAALQYGRRVQLPWARLLPATTAAFIGSLAGAWLVTVTDPTLLRKGLPFVLFVLFVYTLTRKDLGSHHAPSHPPGRETVIAASIGLAIGWYDGFFGPGTGSFLVFFFVRFLGYDFLHASAAAKLLNVATNLSALIIFISKGHIWWQLGLLMAVANVAGSVIGSRLALKHGAGFVRIVFIIVVGGLILKTAYDAFLK
jgi:uncharacterized membrane protein YfcA